MMRVLYALSALSLFSLSLYNRTANAQSVPAFVRSFNYMGILETAHFSPFNASELVSCGKGGARFWHKDSGLLTGTYEPPESQPWADDAAFIPGQPQAFLVSGGHYVFLMNRSSYTIPFLNYSATEVSKRIVLFPDAKTLLTTRQGGLPIRVWQIATASPVPVPLPAPVNSISMTDVDVKPDGVAGDAAGVDGWKLYVWNSTAYVNLALGGGQDVVRFNPLNGSQLAVGGGSKLTVFELTGQLSPRQMIQFTASSGIQCLEWNPWNASQIATGHNDGTATLWTITVAGGAPVIFSNAAAGTDSKTVAVAFSTLSPRDLLTGHRGGTTILWDLGPPAIPTPVPTLVPTLVPAPAPPLLTATPVPVTARPAPVAAPKSSKVVPLVIAATSGVVAVGVASALVYFKLGRQCLSLCCSAMANKQQANALAAEEAEKNRQLDRQRTASEEDEEPEDWEDREGSGNETGLAESAERFTVHVED
eukprot:TRINITY_DN3371_c0_g1_i1.p2 TRINITY_DN3371_c0_g1~~TRINITY_DN3371_c0_g1_i1.p2  ORF type:complete len:485 (-),score=72.98 TRINITY_DN3371_c0_g1_i1:162-1592(-)